MHDRPPITFGALLAGAASGGKPLDLQTFMANEPAKDATEQLRYDLLAITADERLAARIVSFSESTLRKWRMRSQPPERFVGPRFVRRGRSVYYYIGDLVAWAAGDDGAAS